MKTKQLAILLICIIFLIGCSNAAKRTYTDRKGLCQLELPEDWKRIGRLDMFSPFSSNDDTSKTMLTMRADSTTRATLPRQNKTNLLTSMNRGGFEILNDKTRNIIGVEAWELIIERKLDPSEPRKLHQIYLIKNGVQVLLVLQASPELYETADMQFEEIIRTLRIL